MRCFGKGFLEGNYIDTKLFSVSYTDQAAIINFNLKGKYKQKKRRNGMK